MARTPLIAGNWKMNLDHLEALSSAQKLTFAFPKDGYEYIDIALTVPFTDLRSIQTLVAGDKLQITYGAQDVSQYDNGAHTGDISAAMLAKLGCTWVVVGHSERRAEHGETDEIVAAKARKAVEFGMSPIVCVGEPEDVRDAGHHVEYVIEQTQRSLDGLDTAALGSVVIAYEPVWAIGTGKNASATDAQEVCHALRGLIRELADDTTADAIRILYGGSVKTDTVAEIISQPDVDGGLIGGASLDGEEFARLAAAAANAVR